MLKENDRVRHSASNDSFGTGTIRKIDEVAGTALVEWDTHEVKRETGKLTQQQSHVKIESLEKI